MEGCLPGICKALGSILRTDKSLDRVSSGGKANSRPTECRFYFTHILHTVELKGAAGNEAVGAPQALSLIPQIPPSAEQALSPLSEVQGTLLVFSSPIFGLVEGEAIIQAWALCTVGKGPWVSCWL